VRIIAQMADALPIRSAPKLNSCPAVNGYFVTQGGIFKVYDRRSIGEPGHRLESRQTMNVEIRRVRAKQAEPPFVRRSAVQPSDRGSPVADRVVQLVISGEA